MTAATLHVVPADPAVKAQYGWLLAARRKAREAYDYALSLPRAAWGWARRTFRLDSLWAMAKDAWSWVTSKAAAAGRLVGLSGGIGLGLLSVTTATGRSILDATIGRALRGVSRAASWVLGKVDSGLRYLGAPGNWVADRILDAKILATQGVTKVVEFYAANIAKHLAYDGPVMTTGKVAGFWMVGLRMLTFIGTRLISWPVYAGLAVYTLMASPLRQVPGFREAADWLAGGEKPTKTELRAVDKDLSDAVSAAAAATATGAPVPTPPGNRAERRAAQQQTAQAKKAAAARR